MTGIVGRLFREFAVTLSAAIVASMAISLTTTPMMCSRFLSHDTKHGRLYRASERVFEWILNTYAACLRGVLKHPAITLLVLLITIGFNVYLYTVVQKGFFPEQDTGRLMGMIQAQQNISFQAMRKKVTFFVNAVMSDPAVSDVVAFTGGAGGTNTGRMFASLKDLDVRKVSVQDVMARIRRKTANMPGATLFLQAVQDIRVGGRSSGAEYQYTLQTQDLNELDAWSSRLLQSMRRMPELTDVNTDQQNNGLQVSVNVDRDTAARLGLSMSDVDNALYDAFGQRLVSTMYTSLNQYHVVMEVAPKYWQDPDTLQNLFIKTAPPVRQALSTSTPGASAIGPGNSTASSNSVARTQNGPANNVTALTTTTTASNVAYAGNSVPLSAFVRYGPSTTPLVVNHQGQFPSVTISFNLRPGIALGEAVAAIERMERQMGTPADLQGMFTGTAEAFQASLANEPVLIATALIAVYIVLGVLYESYVHPITILSTLPPASLGAVLALLLTKTQLDVISITGIILLIGIVKKNAIMMIDFALNAERTEGRNTRDSIFEASILRFRPILMTTMAALFGAVPLAVGMGIGAELRRPLGISIIGGLIVSQALTLYTTPVIYLFLDRLRLRLLGGRHAGA